VLSIITIKEKEQEIEKNQEFARIAAKVLYLKTLI